MTLLDAPPRRGEIAAVAIGRNEGERLRQCLVSLLPHVAAVVYVDSGSTDRSVELARALGATVVNLDLSRPYTAARARNEGLARVARVVPDAQLVQFIDGDCEIVPGWIESAVSFLRSQREVAAVCGRRRERHPDSSIYNLLCDMEWDTPVGEARACGGDVLLRVDALRQIGGYRADLIAGEEPELCVRLRAKGWRIWRLDAEMTSHDAAIVSFRQWWLRTMRTGYAFAQGAHIHGAAPERHWVREARSACLWGLVLPLAILLATAFCGPWALAAMAAYPLQVLRSFFRTTGIAKARVLRATFLVLGKFPEALGGLKFHAHRWAGGTSSLIEYK